MAIKNPIEGQEVWFIDGYNVVCGIFRKSTLLMSVVYNGHWIDIHENLAFNTREECLGYIAIHITNEINKLNNILRDRMKELYQTRHDHNPVNDAMGNAEVLQKLLYNKSFRQSLRSVENP